MKQGQTWKFTIKYSAPSFWNSIPEHIKNYTTENQFKYKLKQCLISTYCNILISHIDFFHIHHNIVHTKEFSLYCSIITLPHVVRLCYIMLDYNFLFIFIIIFFFFANTNEYSLYCSSINLPHIVRL